MGLSTSPVITPPPVNWLAFQPAGSGSTFQPLAHSVIVPFTRLSNSQGNPQSFTGRMMGLGIQGHEIGVAQLQAMKAEITDRRITKALWDQLSPNAQHFLLAQVKKGMANLPNGFGLGMGPEEYEPFISKAIQEAQRMSKAEPSALEQKNQEIAVRNEKLESTAKWINMFGPKSSSIESALMQILNERTQGMELNQADQVLNKILSDPNEMDTIYRSALQRLGDPAAGLGKPRENAKEYLRAYYQLVTGIKDPSLLNALADQTLSQIELSIPNKELNPVQKVDHFLRFFISGSPQTNQELIVSSGLKMLTPRLDAKTPPEALRGPLAEWLFRTVASDPNVQKLRKQLEASGINPEKDERLLSLNAQVAIQKLQWLNSRSKLANETLNSIIKGAQNLPIPSAQGTTQPPAWPNALPEALPEKFTDLPALAQEIYKNLAAAHGLEADELFYEQKRLRAAGKPQATAQDAADSLTTNKTQSSSNPNPLSSSSIVADLPGELERAENRAVEESLFLIGGSQAAAKFHDGGMARDGLFSDIRPPKIKDPNDLRQRQKREREFLDMLNKRADELVESGDLILVTKIGQSNNVYYDPKTKKIYRIGYISEREIRITYGMGKISPPIGPELDLAYSLYLPTHLGNRNNSSSRGVGVLVLENLSGGMFLDNLRKMSEIEKIEKTEAFFVQLGRFHALTKMEHGDLHQFNAMLDGFGNVRLIDFGQISQFPRFDPSMPYQNQEAFYRVNNPFKKDIERVLHSLKMQGIKVDAKLINDLQQAYQKGVRDTILKTKTGNDSSKIPEDIQSLMDQAFDQIRKNLEKNHGQFLTIWDEADEFF